MGKMKATFDTAIALAGDGEASPPANNVTPIASRANQKAPGDEAKVVEAAGTSEPENEPAIILFGKDESGKAHASWFGEADAKLAERAAGLMGYSVLRVNAPDARALELPQGRIFASGKGFVPFAKMAAYEALQAFPGAFAPPPPPEPQPEPPLAVTDMPQRWEDLQVGSLVLATTAPGDGWYEAIVAEARGDAIFVLRWQGWADHDPFVRRADGLALLPARPTEEAAAGD